MLRSRLIAGTIMAGVGGLVFGLDTRSAPVYPLLFLAAMLAGTLAALELRELLPPADRPPRWLVLAGVLGTLAANWADPVIRAAGHAGFADPWRPVVVAVAAAVVAAFLVELATFRSPSGAIGRVAHLTLAVCYLGLLSSFLLQLRWAGDPTHSAWLLALAVFVPKCCDIGAYTAGRLFGRTPFTPNLSPKKTWEGIAGGLALGAGTAAGIHAVHPVFAGGWPEAVAFGVAAGAAGVFGDLAESLVKREAGAKDAAARVPGFGGVLDVFDSVLFAAPVAYLWVG